MAANHQSALSEGSQNDKLPPFGVLSVKGDTHSELK
jgi:hypothetical protein